MLGRVAGTEVGKERRLESSDSGACPEGARTPPWRQHRAAETSDREPADDVFTAATPLSAGEEMGPDGKVGRPPEAATRGHSGLRRGQGPHRSTEGVQIWEAVQARLPGEAVEGGSQGLTWGTQFREGMLFVEMRACLR